MFRYLSFSFLLFFLQPSAIIRAQTLYQPRDIKQAYKAQTRSSNGKPGKNYWQNRAKYDIDVTVLPPDRIVRGKEKITYVNNSPDTLYSIVIKLILNNHKPGSARYGAAGRDYLTEGVSIDAFDVNGRPGLWKEGMGETTRQAIKLSKPLFPKDSLTCSVSWHYPVSLQSGREGRIDSTTFYLAYFYPRIAVYDDYNGWDLTEHTGSPEFYNDFNDYRLTVNVPANFVVWATGDLMNPSEVLQSRHLERLTRSLGTDSIVHVATHKEMLSETVTAQNKLNQWKFHSSNVSDVAFGVSNHFVWDATSAVVDEKTGRRASMQAAYADTTSSFRDMAKWGAYALHWFSHNWPGVPYPYPKMTAFQGDADMEYPMMINDSPIPGLEGRRVANHEIAHTWFPFFMGTNETRYAFMDEAWATTLEFLIAPSYMDRLKAEENYKRVRVSKWVNNSSQATDLPIITPSYELKEAYRTNAYGKPSLAYLALKDMLGDQMFKKCLHEYMNRWSGKHPTPWDFFFTFNNVSGKDLNWFWTNWFFSNNYIDLGLGAVNKTASGYLLTVENPGGFAVPFDIRINYADGRQDLFHQDPSAWKENQQKVIVNLKISRKVKSITLDGNVFIDSYPENNQWMNKGI